MTLQTGGALQRDLELPIDGPISQLNERALAALEEAAKTTSFDADLLQTRPAQDMRAKILEINGLLQGTDHQKFMRNQGWIARFTGADVEARLRFELASQMVAQKLEELRRTAQNGHRILDLLCKAEVEIMAEQTRFETVIANAQHLLAGAVDADEFLRSRFERRVSNIMSVSVANVLTLEQISLAKNVLTTLIDRVIDVDTTLFPLWQRTVLALAHASPAERKAAETDFVTSRGALIKTLQQE